MTRSMKWLGVAVCCASVLAACSSSGSSKTKSTETIGNSLPQPVATTEPPAIGTAACGLVSSAQLTSLLGSAVKGTESDASSTNRECRWAGPPASGANNGTGAVLLIGVIRTGNGNVGYSNKILGFSPETLAGIGTAATYLTGSTKSGAAERIIVTYKGNVSLSLAVTYPAGASVPSTVKQDFGAIAKHSFTQLHA